MRGAVEMKGAGAVRRVRVRDGGGTLIGYDDASSGYPDAPPQGWVAKLRGATCSCAGDVIEVERWRY